MPAHQLDSSDPRLHSERVAGAPGDVGGLGAWLTRHAREVDLTVVLALVAWVILGLIRWHAAKLLEDHDSIDYLLDAHAFLSGDLQRFLNSGPENTPLFPALAGLFSLPGWSPETGARLVSFVAGLGLFAALVALGRRMGDQRGTALGLWLVALNPVLLDLSSSVLSEPLYIALVYAGFALFWAWCREPSARRGAVLGLIFGLAFLDRTEGILFLAGIPLLQGLHFLVARGDRYTAAAATRWVVAYSAAFLLLAGPQIWNVSRQAHRFLINGRQIWSAMLTDTRGRSYDEIVWGLDYTPTQTNVVYLRTHPDALARAAVPPGFKAYAGLVARNLEELGGRTLGLLIGRIALLLAAFGLVAFAARRDPFELLLVSGVLGLMLAGPLLYNVVMRHVAIVAPLLLLFAGMGLADIARRLASAETFPQGTGRAVEAVGICVVVAAWLGSLHEVLRPSLCNVEYCAGANAVPARLVREAEARRGARAIVASRKRYLPYDANAQRVPVPFADANALATYLRANNVDFLYIEQATVSRFPFYPAFEAGHVPPGLTEVYRAKDAWGRGLTLYQLARP